MNERTIYKISFATMIIGITVLFFYADQFSVERVESIETRQVEEEVALSGTISQLRKTDTVYFLTIDGTKTIKTEVVFFPDEDIYVKQGQFVEVIGTVEEYKGKKELIANKITVK